MTTRFSPRRAARALLSIAPILLFARGAAAQPAPAWSVEAPTGPSKTIAFDATEGTWMSLSVSPDGRTLLFDLLGHLYELPIDGGSAKRLTSGRSWNLFPRYSPDGRSIAFSSDRAGSFDIWTLDRTTGALERVSRAVIARSENYYRPTWSADGRSIYATVEGDGAPNQLVALDRQGGMQRLVEGGNVLGGAVAEPDGSGLLFERRDAPLYTFAFNPYVTPTSGVRIDRYDRRTGEVVTRAARPGGAFAPALSPNGRELAYLHRSIDETILIVRDLVTGRERTLARGVDRDRQQGSSTYGPAPAMAWHPAGAHLFIAFGGKIHRIATATGADIAVPFTARVEREASETIRFRHEEPVDRATTRAHRWGTRIAAGVLYEALGDLWIADGRGAPRSVTRTAMLESSPIVDPTSGALYFAGWTDDSLGAVYRKASFDAPAVRLTSVPAQYGSLALAPDGARLAFVRGAPGLAGGAWLSNETDFDLIVRDADGTEHRVTGVSGHALEYANIAGKIPPSVTWQADGRALLFSEFEGEKLVLKRVAPDGSGETVLYALPNAVAVVPSPDLSWLAVREYQRSYLIPWSFAGKTVTLSPFEGVGASLRIDAEDGGYLTWSPDARTIAWTRARGFYEKSVTDIVAESRAPRAAVATAGAAPAWTGPRVPGSTARRTELGIDYTVDRNTTPIALTGARLVTMNARRDVLERATIVLADGKISALGTNVAIPAGAKVFDLGGATVIPGLIDAHAHPHIEQSALHVIEQQPTYFSAPLAYGVTTMVEVYGNEYRDAWLNDRIRAGQVAGPRFFTTGSVIYGGRAGARRLMYRPIATLDDAREQLRWNRDHGAIAVKDYVQDVRLRRSLTVTAARELGLNVLSESAADPQMNFTQLLDGITGLEHSMGHHPFYGDVVTFWGRTGAGMTPTLLVAYNVAMGEGWYHQQSKLWEDPKLTRFITPEQLMRVRSPTKLWPEDMSVWAMGAELRKLYRNGTSLQLGAHGQMFGIDAHWELDLFKRSGFAPQEILEIATIRGAAQHGLDAQLGSLEVGKFADLVVLDANPLDDIGNASKIRYVMKNGILFSGADAARVWPDPRATGKPYFVGR